MVAMTSDGDASRKNETTRTLWLVLALLVLLVLALLSRCERQALRVASFNIETYPQKGAEQERWAFATLESLDASIVALQEITDPEGFAAFLDRHRAVRDLLAGAEQIDVMGYKQLAYATTRYFSPDGWYLTGESAAFSDPFYSPGSDFIALENDYITDLIRREVAGEAADEVRALATTYDQYMRYRFKSTMLIYKHLYPVLGSYELLCLKWSFDIASYYNMWGHYYITDQHLDLRTLRTELRRQVPILDGQEQFAALFHKLGVELSRQGNYYRSNLGEFTYGIEHIDWLSEIFTPRSKRRIMEVNVSLFNLVRERAHRILYGADVAVPPLDLAAFSDMALI